MTARLDVIGLVVADMGRSLEFYRRLGLDVPAEAGGDGHVETRIAGGLRLTWDTIEEVRKFDEGWTPASGGPRMGFAFLMDSPADVDRTYERLVGLGYEGHKAPWDAFWGQRYAVVHDPDGNGVDLFAPLPASS